MMRAVLVGAGAVGQVFGLYLQRGGARLGFLVRPKHAEEARRGYAMYELGITRQRTALRLDGFDVATSAAETAALDPDVIMLCVSSTQLRGGWLEELCTACPRATIVMLQPALDDNDYVVSCAGAERVVCGMIPFLSYAAPLPGENVPEPGVAFWIPPMSVVPFSGPAERVRPILDALRSGGLSARKIDDVTTAAAAPSAVLAAIISGLGAAGWSFAAFGDGALLARVAKAAGEAIAVVEKRTGSRVAMPIRMLATTPVLAALLRVAPHVAPVDLETYLRVHFTKVRDQTQRMMRLLVDEGRRLSVGVEHLEELRRVA